MNKNELICKLKLLGFKKDKDFLNSYIKGTKITVYFSINTNYVIIISDTVEYIDFPDAIKYIISIDK